MGTLTALSPLVGKWSTTITLSYPAEQDGQQFQAKDTYRWLPGENILVHEVDGQMNGTPVRSIEIYARDKFGKIQARSFDSGGQVSDFTAAMADGEWRIDGDTQRFASTQITSDIIEGLWQIKTDGAWRDWMTVSLKRQK